MNASAIFAFFRPSRTDFALLNAFSNASHCAFASNPPHNCERVNCPACRSHRDRRSKSLIYTFSPGAP